MLAPSSLAVQPSAALNCQVAVAALDFGSPHETCAHCGATFFSGEATYISCCRNGTIAVASPAVPDEIAAAIGDSHVHNHIRQYNAALALASVGYSGTALSRPGMPPGRPHVDGWGSLKISGRPYHRIGPLSPDPGCQPVWGQLFMLDAADASCQRVAGTRCAAQLRPAVLAALHASLLQHNQWVQDFVAAGTGTVAELSWSSEDLSQKSGMVAICAAAGPRSIVVRRRSEQLVRISDQHPLYFPLAYVLLFPTGGLGYSPAMTRTDPSNGEVLGKMHMLEWARYMMMRRSGSASLILSGGKLTLEFWCDVWCSIECRNLDYIAGSNVQMQMRMASRRTLMDQLQSDGSAALHRLGAPVYLPAHFVGSPRWYHALFLDALALPTEYHLPDLFITVTFNPEWPELARMMPSHGNVHDHADVVARVFWFRFMRIMADIVDNAVFGTVLSYCYRIEWQLRGFPHAHVLIILERRILGAAEVDRFVTAEIPDPISDPEHHRLVLQFMVHGPCNVPPVNAPCIADGICGKGFPKQLQPLTIMVSNAYPLYVRRGRFVGQVRGHTVSDNWVVPHNRYLLLRHGSHINVEVASGLLLYKYVYKYCFKAPDHGTISLNEIEAFIQGRMLSSAEAVWRILQLPLHREYPTVQRLQVHLPDHHQVVFGLEGGEAAAAAAADAATSTLLRWFDLNRRDPAARCLLYKDVPKRYTWQQKTKEWRLRRRSCLKVGRQHGVAPHNHELSILAAQYPLLATHSLATQVGRLHGVAPHNVELFMLRRLLLVVPGAQSWDDLRRVGDQVLPSFEAAVRARGMLQDDCEILSAFREMVRVTICDSRIRRQWVMYLVFCRPSQPRQFFDDCRQSLFPPECDAVAVWQELEQHARDFRVSLSDYAILPPSICVAPLPLLSAFDPVAAQVEADERWLQLNAEQRSVAATILDAVAAPHGLQPRVFMLQASGGCGKSFVCNYIAARVRSLSLSAICVAASAQAATNLTGGRTAHGQLKIPIDCDAGSYLNLSWRDKEELSSAAVLLWDEASMVSDVVADCVDRSLQDIKQCSLPFGGMPVVFVGDFRQLLPVIPKGRGDLHTVQRCSWWSLATMLHLRHNFRSQQVEWLQLLDDVGMGRIAGVSVPAIAAKNSLAEVIAHVWERPEHVSPRAILTLTLEDAAEVNRIIIQGLPGKAALRLLCSCSLPLALHSLLGTRCPSLAAQLPLLATHSHADLYPAPAANARTAQHPLIATHCTAPAAQHAQHGTCCTSPAARHSLARYARWHDTHCTAPAAR